MQIPKLYRKINPSWLHYWRLAHSQHCPSGIFTPEFKAPTPYIDQQS